MPQRESCIRMVAVDGRICLEIGMTCTVERERVLRQIAEKILAIPVSRPLRVGVDGGSASGKTVFADQLGKVLEGMGRDVIRAGLDGFHNPSEIRYRKGNMSMEGYVQDSFDYPAVWQCILNPLGPGGDRQYQMEVFDHHSEEGREPEVKTAPEGAILIFEGVMLFREELVEGFDYRIKVDTSPEVKLERAKKRDLAKFGSLEQLLEKYTKRFLPGQQWYRDQYRPKEIADVVVGNDDPGSPQVQWNAG